MRAMIGLIGCLAVVAGLGKPVFAQAAPGDVLEALTAKTAAIRDYHYRVEWTLAGGVPIYIVEVWYAGPDRVRMTTGYGGQERPLGDTVVNGDEAYSLSSHQCEVTRLSKSRRRARFLWGRGEMTEPVFLQSEHLAGAAKARAAGREAVGGAACEIVDLALTTTDSALFGSLEQEDDDFVAFIPQTRGSGDLRLWVDVETGMVRRWGRVSGGRVRETAEVVETQQVNGFAFPAVLKMTQGNLDVAGQVTAAEVNQGIEEALADFRPPANWLVNDETLTLDQARERVEANPDDANLHYTLGTLYHRGQRREDAEREFRRAAELAPESPTPLFAMAWAVRVSEKRDNEAIVDLLRQAMARGGEHSWHARTALAEALKGAGKDDEAIAEYRAVVAAGPPLSYWAVGQLATALADKGDFEGAYRAGAEALAFMPLAMGPMGTPIVEWAEKSNNLDDLRAKAEQALAADPESGAARVLLVKVLHAQGRKAEAAEALRAIRLTEEPAQLLERSGGGASELISLARELGEEEFAAEVRRAAIRQMIASGLGWGISEMLGDQSDAIIREVIPAAAALWAEAGDARSRAAILDAVSQVPRSVGRHWGRETWPQADPDEMTPAECAMASALMVGMSERASEGEEIAEARRRAEAYFDRALAEWPDDVALWAAVGKLRWYAQAWREAGEAYGKAAAGDPDQIEYPARVAFALTRIDQCDRALETARKTIEPWLEEWAAKTFVASVEMNCGELEPARDTLVAVYDSPEVASYQKVSVGRMLARCHERLGELEQAEVILKRAVGGAERWNRVQASQRLIQFYARHGRREDAYATAKAMYVGAEERDWERHTAVSETQQAFEDDADALVAAVRADLEAHPGDIGTVEFAAAIYERIGRRGDAMPLLREVAEKANDAGLWTRIADLAEREEDAALAVEALRRALELRPDDRELRTRYARAVAAQGDRTAAKTLADELRGAAGDSPAAWRGVAELYLTAESWDDALAAAERVVALTPEDDEVARMRAQVLAARAYAGKRDDHEARKRLIPILARTKDRTVLREAAEALVDLYLLRGERDQAIATLTDLRMRTQSRGLQYWIDERLKEIVGEEPPEE